ncbi:hypothetical protein HDA40_001605 [Hamadaea flava]|uniref:DUF6182 family protein n=1 Tax=Hamadaea flava TaxID=1742688 RepID=A0ABV8LMS0_9ACTN|nr:DUF6182 family protein [Hamadaea flava]MCP2323098.1 hypothetical protein [Hamadaea flava]
MDEQQLLGRLLLAHYERVSRGLADDAEPTAPPTPRTVPMAPMAPTMTGYRVSAVIGTFDLRTFVTGALGFAAAVPEPARDPWYRSFTRAVFFAGNPDSVARRFPCDHVTDGIAWLGPAPDDPKSALSRGLKLLRAPAPCTSLPGTLTITVPGPPGEPTAATGNRHRLDIAVGGVTVAEYLVHVHHVLCEAVLRRTLRPGDELTIAHVDRLTVDEHLATATHLRISDDPHQTGNRRLYARLTSDVPTHLRETADD